VTENSDRSDAKRKGGEHAGYINPNVQQNQQYQVKTSTTLGQRSAAVQQPPQIQTQNATSSGQQSRALHSSTNMYTQQQNQTQVNAAYQQQIQQTNAGMGNRQPIKQFKPSPRVGMAQGNPGPTNMPTSG
jgi:hypothetical protein